MKCRRRGRLWNCFFLPSVNTLVWPLRLTSARARAEKGVSSAGFTTTVQPAARAAPTLRVIMALGKFHWRQKDRRLWEYASPQSPRAASRQQIPLHNWQAKQFTSCYKGESSEHCCQLERLQDKGSKRQWTFSEFKTVQIYLHQGSGNSFRKGPDNKYFRLCEMYSFMAVMWM